MRVPFPFQAVVKLLLLSFSSGLVLYAVPNLAGLLQYPLKAEGMVASLLGVCGVSIVTPLFFRCMYTSVYSFHVLFHASPFHVAPL